jgi:AraC-like DNA-binding protein/mannose-6-phosphate isomerase-like protein (cupin superfamily)
MNPELLERLQAITKEEQEILENHSDQVKRELYTSGTQFEVDGSKLLGLQQIIMIRPHTRFVNFPEHKHNYIEIMYVCQGKITHIVDGKEVVMETGDILMMNQHVRHCVQKAGKDDIGINFIARPAFFDIPLSMLGKNNLLAQFLVDTLRKHTSISQYLHFRLRQNRAIDNMMENIVESILRNDGRDYNLNQITMGLIFLHLLNHMDKLDLEFSQDYRDVLVHTALQYINDCYSEANLSQLAEELHQSLSTLSRLIKQNTGFTFQELVQKKKFEKAVTLLLDTNLPISEIVAAVGYENSSYFYRKFREKYQVSPKEYREEHKENQIRTHF